MLANDEVPTRGEAACLVLGEPITQENRRVCKEYIDSTRFEVVFTRAQGVLAPQCVGSNKVQRDIWTYRRYTDTPPPEEPEELRDEEVEEPQDEETEEEPNLPAAVVEDVEPTQHAVLSLFRAIAPRQQPASTDNYKQIDLDAAQVTTILNDFLPTAVRTHTIGKIMKWIGHDELLPTGTRSASQRRCSIWLLRPDPMIAQVQQLFNRRTFKEAVRSAKGWITIGYARKSTTKEEHDKYSELLQGQIDHLRLEASCKRVYASPYCNASSPLLLRDMLVTDARTTINDSLHFKQGDFQDFIAYAITSNKSIRLVFRDYAGLSTKGSDVVKFLEELPMIQELVVDHIFHLESISRNEILNNVNGVLDRFTKCRKGAVPRGPIMKSRL